eukprot:11531742-Alexandrium_andersonii.AAC.1
MLLGMAEGGEEDRLATGKVARAGPTAGQAGRRVGRAPQACRRGAMGTGERWGPSGAGGHSRLSLKQPPSRGRLGRQERRENGRHGEGGRHGPETDRGAGRGPEQAPV